MAQKKAYVRYADNKAVPGSLIVRTKAPSVGTWKEVPYDICCDSGGDCTPPLFTPIELRVGPGNGCGEEYETVNWFIYQTSLFGIPIVKLVTETISLTPADAGGYFVPSIGKVVAIVGEGQIANVSNCA